jgi:hypothetical protein
MYCSQVFTEAGAAPAMKLFILFPVHGLLLAGILPASLRGVSLHTWQRLTMDEQSAARGVYDLHIFGLPDLTEIPGRYGGRFSPFDTLHGSSRMPAWTSITSFGYVEPDPRQDAPVGCCRGAKNKK